MKTLKLSKATMEKRVSKFAELEPLPIQIDKTVPQAGKDIVYAGNFSQSLAWIRLKVQLPLIQGPQL